MVGEGGMSISEWRRIKDMRLCLTIMKGIARRYRATWETVRIHIRATAQMIGCKNILDEYPFTLPWQDTRDNDQLSDADQERCMMDAEALFTSTFNR